MPVAQSLVNALFHLAASIALGDYAPGAGTGAVVSIPAAGYFFAWSDARPAPPRPTLSPPSRSAPSLRRSRSGSCSCPDRGAGFRPYSAQTARYLTNQTISQNAGALRVLDTASGPGGGGVVAVAETLAVSMGQRNASARTCEGV
jgi:hypothetical protein